jgi:signal transduction histidine kinase
MFRVSVSDHGRGIDPEFLPRIFERFSQQDATTTRSHGGLGLGLAIVKQLTDLLGGSIEAFSDGPGKGARFTVKIPLSENAAHRRSARAR